MRFSIIIPVYNVEKYIDKCMRSVMEQTFRDYEVIVVDDESPDGSMDIVETYAERYPDQIRVIHQKNTRQGGARNHGAAMAKGEYILFVDSDDYVSTDMLAFTDQKLRETPCDILVFSYTTVSEDGTLLTTEIPSELPPGVYNPRENRELLLLPCGPVNKAFRRSFYEETGFRFPEKLLYEDGVTRLLYASASSVRICRESLYYYVQRGNSSMRQKITPKMLDILPVTDLVLEQFRDRGLYETFREPLDTALIYSILYILEIINLEQPRNPMQEKMADYLGNHFPDYRRNPYASPELKRILDCLTAHQFQKYHYRFLMVNRLKEKLLRIPLLNRLNRLRRGS